MYLLFTDIMSGNDTINLDDSSVLSSTKNSSVLEVTTNLTDSVIDIVSSDTEGEDDVNSTSENVDSSSERLVRENSKDLSTAELLSEDEMSEQTKEHYVTTSQSLQQSSVYSATLLMSDISSDQVYLGLIFAQLILYTEFLPFYYFHTQNNVIDYLMNTAILL